ncbi:MAG: hypothetical protein EBU75_08900 [Betaproteobacteria bacterium]|nr:hypothetical protein [Betaproteobacteria bacterium]
MHTLRTSKLIARLVLVWFALFMGSAIASSIIKPDCPLCASVSAPPPPLTVHFEKLTPLAHALHPIAAAHIASATAPPLPSRGPPTSLL